jgi:hypothetical protein
MTIDHCSWNRSLCYNKEDGAVEIQASASDIKGYLGELVDFSFIPEMTLFGDVQI